MSTTKGKKAAAGKAIAQASRKLRGAARDEAKAKKLAEEMAKTPAGKKMKIDVSVNNSAYKSSGQEAIRVPESEMLHAALEVLCTESVCTVSLLQRRLSIGYVAANKLMEQMVAERYADWFQSGGCQATAETMENWNNAGQDRKPNEIRATVDIGSEPDTRTTVKLAGGPAVPLEQLEAAVAGKPSTPEAHAFVGELGEMLTGKRDEAAAGPRASVMLSIPTDIGKIAAEQTGGRYAIGDVAFVSTADGASSYLLATNGWMLAVADCQRIDEGQTLEAKVVPQWLPKEFARTDGKSVGMVTLRRCDKRDLFDSGLFWVRLSEGKAVGRFAAQPTGGNFPPVAGLARDITDDLRVAIDAEDLALLSKAINAVGAPGRSVVVLSISRKTTRESVIVLGDAGFAIMMPKEAETGQFVHGYSLRRQGVLRASRSEGSVVAKPTSDQAGSGEKLFNEDADEDL